MPRLLILSAVRWNFLWQRHQALAVAASEHGWEVDFLEPPLRGAPHIASAIAQRARGRAKAKLEIPVPSGIRVATPPHHFWFLPAEAKRRQLGRLLPGRYDACLLYLPTEALVDFAERSARRLVYDEVVDWATAPKNWFAPSDSARAEAAMDRGAWLHMTDSPAVAEQHAVRGGDCVVVPPAADNEFVTARWSAPQLSDPVLYFGTVRHAETDLKLLCELAAAGIATRVVGPIDHPDAKRLLAQSGVRCDSAVTPSVLPDIINQSRALVLPYRSSRGDTLVPAKLWNCLATDRPIFTRGLWLPAKLQPNFVQLPENDVEAVRTVRSVMATDAVRTPLVQTWTDRWDLVEELLRAR